MCVWEDSGGRGGGINIKLPLSKTCIMLESRNLVHKYTYCKMGVPWTYFWYILWSHCTCLTDSNTVTTEPLDLTLNIWHWATRKKSKWGGWGHTFFTKGNSTKLCYTKPRLLFWKFHIFSWSPLAIPLRF